MSDAFLEMRLLSHQWEHMLGANSRIAHGNLGHVLPSIKSEFCKICRYFVDMLRYHI